MREVLATKKLLHQGPLVLVNRDHPLQMEKSPHLVPVDEQRPHLLLEKLTARLLMACMEDVLSLIHI